ncbi:hypothetical protein [Prosthecobacter vanneervenii]|uniref:Uncharacterized protein n=1 Tax=Prosthecobacter vanneervenii TaxID=48466 RepID=A0A7W7YA01_9BACT|nr:hypothetical protein [Prosthecobacter vanneervenii]MBB5032324.1 hypothetical protein [Prosthecobacter vanneervenii]
MDQILHIRALKPAQNSSALIGCKRHLIANEGGQFSLVQRAKAAIMLHGITQEYLTLDPGLIQFCGQIRFGVTHLLSVIMANVQTLNQVLQRGLWVTLIIQNRFTVKDDAPGLVLIGHALPPLAEKLL